MGFGGSAQSMNTIMKNNRALLRKKGSMFKPKKGHLMSSAESENQDVFVDHQKATPLMLEQIREKLQKASKRKQILSLVIFLVLLIPTLWIIHFIKENGKTELEYHEKDATFFKNEVLTEFDLLLRDGDDWFSQGNYKNALIQYEKSLELNPENYSVQYRICLVYGHMCRYKKENCLIGKAFYDATVLKFPENLDLEELVFLFD